VQNCGFGAGLSLWLHNGGEEERIDGGGEEEGEEFVNDLDLTLPGARFSH
jgi:hypothetical protein